MLEKDFQELIINVKKDILSTQYKIIQNANLELLNLYYRLGKIISENVKYGNKFIENVSLSLKLEFSNMTGFSKRNLSRMKNFYEEYKDSEILPPSVAKLPWTHNYLLIEKVKDKEIRYWYAEKCFQNGWSKIVLNHQIDLQLYERQVLAPKLTNFEQNLPNTKSELAKEILKDPYIFELAGIKEKSLEKDIETAMLEKIKNIWIF